VSWNGTSYDLATIVYSAGGSSLWTNLYNGPANGDDRLTDKLCFAICPDGGAVAAGTSDGDPTSSTIYDFAIIKYLTPPSIRFTGIGPLPDMACRLTISAPSNVSFGLERSTNLRDWSNLTYWINVVETSIQYTDAPAQSIPFRFYRTVST